MPADLSFDTVLIANRGEIAVRVIRTCRELGLRTVAVYSDADQNALHVRLADAAVRIGPAPSSESYLRADQILDAARQTGAGAIHPGYGFLSENAAFARACAEAGIVFIGPPPRAIELMGDKTAARALMQKAAVPMAPGTPNAVEDPAEAELIAGEIGYPVLVKAAAGGGGKGMRVVERADEFQASFVMAQSEARSAFGDDRVYIEKYLTGPRHIEIQVLADTHGNVVHLFERECSIQRRHQKVVEEAPSAVLTADLRRQIGEAAVAAARACDYVGAGTVEFLYDDGAFYFLEMNTRLQVEHPVTEWIVGLDLVAEQLRIARGELLGYNQDELSIRGHSIECRVYAENVAEGFLPDPGPLHRHRAPLGPGVRVDSGVTEGDEVPIHYDPMISKLTTWAPTREGAIDRMIRALAEYEIGGVNTTIPFCRFVMAHDAFRRGTFDTGFVNQHFAAEALAPTDSEANIAALATLLTHKKSATSGEAVPSSAPPTREYWSQRRRRV